MIEKAVVFVDWAPISSKSDIRYGGHIRRYYAWITLNKMVDRVIPFRKKRGDINWKAIPRLLDKDTKIWVEYGCGRKAHLFVLLASFIRPKKGFILNVHDFGVLEQRDYDKEVPFIKRISLQIIERLLLKRASAIILAWPRLLDYFTPKKEQKVVIMVPGVGEDELFVHPSNKIAKGKKIALYFGSMRRKDAIPKIIKLFSGLKGWELHLIGLKEGVEIAEIENVTYLGSVSHDKLADIICDADVILVPYPKNEYLDRVIPIKLGYILKSCKPIITTKLEGISDYISMLGLEENVIYMDEWSLDSLGKALEKSQHLDIDAEKTIERLKQMAWEPRFEKAVGIALVIGPKRFGDAETGALQEI